MKTLAEEILELIPAYPNGLTIAEASDRLAADAANVRKAFQALNVEAKADFVRLNGARRRLLFLLGTAPRDALRICVICASDFQPKKKYKARTCCNACQGRLMWITRRARGTIGLVSHSAERRAAQGERQKRLWKSPKHAAIFAEKSRNNWRNPETRAKMLRGLRAARNDPEYKANLSAKAKARWARPEFRERASANIRRAANEPERHAKISIANKRRWADPATRARLLAVLTPINRSEAKRESSRAVMAELKADPAKMTVLRAKQKATCAARWAAQKSAAKLEQMKKMISAGARVADVAVALDEPYSRVRRWMREEGIKPVWDRSGSTKKATVARWGVRQAQANQSEARL